MTLLTLAALTLLTPPPQEWTALDLPGLSVPRTPSPGFPALTGGLHVEIEPEPRSTARSDAAVLQPALALQMLESEARRGGHQVEVFPGMPPLIVRGAPAEVAWARGLLDRLDAAGRRMEVELSAWLVPLPEGAPDAAATLPEEAALPPGSRIWRARGLSGDTLALGQRLQRPFVASYDIEVASDSGVATPILGLVRHGDTLHVRACRLGGGRLVHVSGFLDMARIASWEEFDPETPDLGDFQQPRVQSAQVAFSGLVEAGGLLQVELRGLPFTPRAWSLWVRAETEVDPLDVPPDDWRVADLALLSVAPRELRAFELGTGLEGAARLGSIGGTSRPLAPASLGAMAQAPQRVGGRNGSPTYPTDRALFLPASELDAWRSVQALTAALLEQRERTAAIELRHGELLLRFPLATGEAARVAVGLERTFVVGYQSEIAPDVWMPSPVVERAFDGLVWQGRLEGGRLVGAAAVARTDAVEVRSRDAAQLAALQLPARSARGEESSHAPAEAPRTLLEGRGDEPGLALRFRLP